MEISPSLHSELEQILGEKFGLLSIPNDIYQIENLFFNTMMKCIDLEETEKAKALQTFYDDKVKPVIESQSNMYEKKFNLFILMIKKYI